MNIDTKYKLIDLCLLLAILALMAWSALCLSGCAVSYDRANGIAFRFEPTLRDYKAIKELSR